MFCSLHAKYLSLFVETFNTLQDVLMMCKIFFNWWLSSSAIAVTALLLAIVGVSCSV
jgi:hypothetical protein